jgi:hypothetical protein
VRDWDTWSVGCWEVIVLRAREEGLAVGKRSQVRQ